MREQSPRGEGEFASKCPLCNLHPGPLTHSTGLPQVAGCRPAERGGIAGGVTGVLQRHSVSCSFPQCRCSLVVGNATVAVMADMSACDFKWHPLLWRHLSTQPM
jgi:hypothetical protein